VVIQCVGEAWCLTLREEHRLRKFENRVLRKIFGPKGENYIMRNFMICTLQQTSFRSSNQRDCDRQGTLHIWGRTQMHTGFQWGNLKERDNLEDKGTDRRILKWIIMDIKEI